MTPKNAQTALTPQKLLADISAGKFSPVYYFYGDEDFRIVEAEKYISSQFLPGQLLMTNSKRIDGKRTPVAELLAELSVFPMLGERQVFVVTDIQHYKPNDLERILKILTPPDKSRVIMFSTPSSKRPKKDAAILRKMNEAAEVVEFKQLTLLEMENLVAARLGKGSIKIERDALKLLTELLAGNRGAAESEIEKLVNYKASGETVTLEDIRTIAGGYQTYEVWDIGHHVVKGQTQKALSLIRRMISEGNTATGILYFLSRHLISLYLVQNNKPLEPTQRWMAFKYREQTGVYDNARLEQMIIQVVETDAQLRRAKVKPELLLEMLVLQIAGERPRRG